MAFFLYGERFQAIVFWVIWVGRSDVVPIGDFLYRRSFFLFCLNRPFHCFYAAPTQNSVPYPGSEPLSTLVLVETELALRARRAQFTQFGVLLVLRSGHYLAWRNREVRESSGT